MREQIIWKIGKDQIFATLDSPAQPIESMRALLIISGGNEIRSGSHGSQSQMAQYFAAKGYYVLRYDRRGIGDSDGINQGFDNAQEDIMAAIHYLRDRFGPDIEISAFGNCDAASAIILYHDKLNLHKIIISNPWTLDRTNDRDGTEDINLPSAAAIRARYISRLKNPRIIVDLFTGKINVGKLWGGLRKASQKEEISAIAEKMADKLSTLTKATHILIAEKDTTALAFMGIYKSKLYERVRANDNIKISLINSASHSFADEKSKKWLYKNIEDRL